MKYRKDKEVFRPRARLISVLGEQLIRDATVGLLELVKNGYDADANCVEVKLLNLLPSFKNNDEEKYLQNITIIIEDNGYGMDLETVINKWLEPATGHKDEAKKNNFRTPKGRLPLGEKGVGRFATQKLGRKLQIISRAKDGRGNLSAVEVKVDIDWDEFDNPEAYLNDIEIFFEEREPKYFINHSGTLLKITQAREPWKERDIAEISSALRRLMSPFQTPKSFQVKLICPDYPKYENLDPGDLLSTSHARMDIIVDNRGIATYDYHFKLDPYEERKTGHQEVDLRLSLEDWEPSDRNPICGPFFMTLYLWDRDSQSLKLSGLRNENRRLLNQYNGVSVFRDGIRVLPYGEPDDDWLETDKTRYMSTSEAISRKNIVGAIEISQTENYALRDKSNREGLIENQAFQDFYDLCKGALKLASKEFSLDRKGIREKQKKSKRELLPAVTQLENSLEAVDSAIDEAMNLANTLINQEKIETPIANEIIAKLRSTQTVLKTATKDTREASQDTLTSFDERQEMLLTLAGLGLAAEQFTHEFARLTRESRQITRQILHSSVVRENEILHEKIIALETALDSLHDLVLQLGPMFYIRRKTNEDNYNIKTLIEYALLLHQGQIEKEKIQIKINEINGKMFVKARRSNLIQVFNNLIDNSCYWLSRVPHGKPRSIIFTILANQNEVVISDNGPGIANRDQSRIFDPFFSNKVDGRGLGLFIARESLAEIQSTIELLENENSEYSFEKGATFLITFSDNRTQGDV